MCVFFFYNVLFFHKCGHGFFGARVTLGELIKGEETGGALFAK